MKSTLFFIITIAFLFCACSKENGSYLNGDTEIFKVVEDNPSFAGCSDFTDKSERKKCSDEKMLAFIESNFLYPLQALVNNVEGTVVVKFVIQKDGVVSNAEVIKDIGYGCGEEALRIVELMPTWDPGRQRGRPVRVQFNLPIVFKL